MFDEQSSLTFSEPSAPAVLHPKAKARRDAIKAAGGVEYEALLQKGREARAKFRREHPEATKAFRQESKRTRPFKGALCAKARVRGRKRGMGATIRPSDLDWPTHCPVLGIEIDYPDRVGTRIGLHVQPNWPSLDRWDNTKGCVPGNVFVISCRANTLKNSGTYEEMLRVARYMAKRP